MKRTPLPRATKPISQKRSKPRRGRLIDKAYLAWMARQPCIISGKLPATTHHVRFCGSPKDDRRTIRLEAKYHLHEAGNFSIERIGKDQFEACWGISIEAEIAKANERYTAETGRS